MIRDLGRAALWCLGWRYRTVITKMQFNEVSLVPDGGDRFNVMLGPGGAPSSVGIGMTVTGTRRDFAAPPWWLWVKRTAIRFRVQLYIWFAR